MFALRKSRLDLMTFQAIDLNVRTSMELDFRLITTSKNIPHIPADALRFSLCPIILWTDKKKITHHHNKVPLSSLKDYLFCVYIPPFILNSIPFPHHLPLSPKNNHNYPVRSCNWGFKIIKELVWIIQKLADKINDSLIQPAIKGCHNLYIWTAFFCYLDLEKPL